MARAKIDSTQIHKVIDSIDLKYKLDYINHKIDNNLNIINGVNDFYDSSWNKLIFIIGVLGILLPIVVQYFQNKNLKLILDEVTNKFDKSIVELKDENKNKLADEIKIFEEKFNLLEEKNTSNEIKIKWSTNLLQARAYLLNKQYHLALYGFLIALDTELNNRDKLKNNIKATLNSIFECLENVTKTTFDKCLERLDENHQIRLDDILKNLENQEDFDLYKELKDKIENQLNGINND